MLNPIQQLVIKILDEQNTAGINEAGSAVEAYQMLTDIHTVSKLRVELAAVEDGAQPFLYTSLFAHVPATCSTHGCHPEIVTYKPVWHFREMGQCPAKPPL